MRSQIKLGKIFGIKVGIHYSWFLIALLIALSLVGQFHQTNPAWSKETITGLAVVTAVLFLSRFSYTS